MSLLTAFDILCNGGVFISVEIDSGPHACVCMCMYVGVHTDTYAYRGDYLILWDKGTVAHQLS